MSVTLLPRLAIAAGLILSAAAMPQPAAAQAANFELPPGYRLSLPVMEKCAAGRVRVYERALVDKRLRAELNDEGQGNQDVQNIDQMVRQFEKASLAAAIMKEAGCPVRDFVLLLVGMTHAGTAQGAPENIEFFRRHEAKIAELERKVDAAQAKFDQSE